MKLNRRFMIVCFGLTIMLLAARAQAETMQGKVLDPVQFTAEARGKATVLNNGSTDTSKRVDRTKRELDRLNKLADDIERYHPDDPNTKGWRDYFDRQYAQFVADRANDENAFIQFRDNIKTSRQFLKLQEKHVKEAAYKGLERALGTAEGWENYVSVRWTNRNARPRRPREAISGSAPSIDDSGPVLLHERLTESGRIGVGATRTVRYRFTNRDKTYRIFFNVQLSEADESGNVVSNPDLEIKPADWQRSSLDPGGKITLEWSVTPKSPREYSVGLQLEETSYLPMQKE